MTRTNISSNATDKKITIKRRQDGVYDIYVNDNHVGYRGSAATAVEYVEQLLID
jgi:hypothetical protein